MNKLVPIGVLSLAVIYFYCCNETFDSGSIRGKRVLVTGSSSGIGEQLAYEYSKLGARVFLAARRQTLLEKVSKRCKELGARDVEFVTSDLGDQKDRDKLIVEVKKRFGGLDHLILNHAVATPGLWFGTKENMTRFRNELNINFISFVDLASQALPMLTESKGNIGVVSSIAGKIGFPAITSYGADKHAMQGFFSALRQEMLLRNTGISVTTCVIGPVDTDVSFVTKEEKEKVRDAFLGGFNVIATPEDTAVAIMRGVTNRKYEIYFGRIAWVIVTAHKLFPACVEGHFGKKFLTIFNIDV